MMYMDKNIKDLSGKTFGEWLVLDIAPSISRNRAWKCRCSCGTEKSVMQKYLIAGKSKSCGCIKKNKGKDRRSGLLNKKFGSLVVTKILPYSQKDRIPYVKCLCDCGNETIINSYDISKMKSCSTCCNLSDSCVGQIFGKLMVIEMLYRCNNQNRTYCRCLCECGNNNFITSLNGLKTGNTKSCGCIHSPSLIGRVFGYLTVVKEIETKGSQRNWECLCKCGQTTTLTSHLLNSGHTSSCGCLRSEKVSRREVFISNYLKDNKVPFETQKSFAGCNGVGYKPLRFDFYLSNINTLIEYDGYQHFNPVEYWGGIKSFNILQENDKIKNEYCASNELNLLRLPYTLTDEEIVSILKNIVFENPVTTIVA